MATWQSLAYCVRFENGSGCQNPPQVRILLSPRMPLWSSGLSHRSFNAKIAGSNPAGGTIINRVWESLANPLTSDVRERWFKSSYLDFWKWWKMF